MVCLTLWIASRLMKECQRLFSALDVLMLMLVSMLTSMLRLIYFDSPMFVIGVLYCQTQL